MRPADILERHRQLYARPRSLADWTRPDVVRAGLAPLEAELADHLTPPGRLLLLGVGGGREAIALARRGFAVTGVDFAPALAAAAARTAQEAGIAITVEVREVTGLRPPASRFDAVWFSGTLYAALPSRALRVGLLRRLAASLRPGGGLVCQVHCDPSTAPRPWELRLRRAVARCTGGYTALQPGDMMPAGGEFHHYFQSPEELRAEFAAAGLQVRRRVAGDARRPTGILLARRGPQGPG